MVYPLMFIYSAFLFFILVPGILIGSAQKGNKYLVAFIHALIFAFLWHLTHKQIWRMTYVPIKKPHTCMCRMRLIA